MPAGRSADMAGRTSAEKILSSRSGQDARAGDIVICEVDLAIGTDGSTPMAIDYFEAMGGTGVARPERVLLSFDHYAPPASAAASTFHQRMRTFAERHGIGVPRVGDGISFQVAAEEGRVWPGHLAAGADSHTVTLGALNAFAVGIGSSDLAACLISGRVWLRVPESVRVDLAGTPSPGVSPKDIALELVRRTRGRGGGSEAFEFHGQALERLDVDDRMVIANLSAEADVMAAIFPADGLARSYLAGRGDRAPGASRLRSADGAAPVRPDPDARYVRTVRIDTEALSPGVSLPHDPARVVPVDDVLGTPVDVVFLGTCSGGRTRDFREALAAIEAGGGVAEGIELVVTPASRRVYEEIVEDGTLGRLSALGATVTTPGCGPCCGTSGPIPREGATVISTANRNFRGRMGSPGARIYLASPYTCGAAAAAGTIVRPPPVRATET